MPQCTFSIIPFSPKLVPVQNLNIYVHDLATGETRQLIEDLSFHRGIAAWAMSLNGAHVTAILEEMIGDTFKLSTGEIRLYSGTQPVNVLYGVSGAAYNPKFSPDGSYLAAAGSDGTLRVWNIETSQRLGTDQFCPHHLVRARKFANYLVGR